ncbi:hypothetical protein CHUAL_013051 [Chamberlinius hualienensis]
MLASEISRRNTIRDVVRSPTPPKYGLPGLGEYDERRNIFLRERKKEYINYLNEQNAKSRRRPNVNDKLLDYEELLAQKRREEYDYRHFASDPSVSNNGRLKPAKSDSNVDKVDNWNGLSFKESQQVYVYGNIDQPRPRSYPPEINMGLLSNSELNREDNLGSNRDPGNRSTANIHLFSFQTDNQSRRQLMNDNFSYRLKNEEERKADYQAELKKQVEDDRQRKAKIREEEEKLNKRLEEECRTYDPWGRDGGGAPRRDKHGRVIASRRYLDNITVDENVYVANAENKGSRRPSKTGTETEANYAIPRSPPASRSPSVFRDERRTSDRYKEELQKQIEDKKLRDQLEKEKERLEEEKLARRIQEQQEKIQREYEEEQKKHRLREEERRRRNEDLQKKHEEQRKETNRKRKEFLDEERKQQWEAREMSLGRVQNETVKTESPRSPPVTSVKPKQEVEHNFESRRNSKDLSSLTSLKPTKPSASRDHILSQLSVMRQQLEKEQHHIQEQLRKQREGNYDKQNNYLEDRESGGYAEIRHPLDGNNKKSANSVSAVVPDIYRPSTVKLKEGKDMMNEGVDGYDFDPRRLRHKYQHDGKISSSNDSPQSDTYDDDRLADLDAARKRYLHSVNDDPDEVNADSFLDEYLARNIRK